MHFPTEMDFGKRVVVLITARIPERGNERAMARRPNSIRQTNFRGLVGAANETDSSNRQATLQTPTASFMIRSETNR